MCARAITARHLRPREEAAIRPEARPSPHHEEHDHRRQHERGQRTACEYAAAAAAALAEARASLESDGQPPARESKPHGELRGGARVAWRKWRKEG
jgi:hypothetical protein